MREKLKPSKTNITLSPLDTTNVQIPYHFRCPISLELMRDPVTVSTGQTYDRSSIESWMSTGNTTCPVTRTSLSDFTLIPNHTLRRLIQDWCVSNHSLGVQRIPTPKQPADHSLIRSLLSQASGPAPGAVAALRRLRALARESEANRSLISSLPVRDVALGLLFSNPCQDSSSGGTSIWIKTEIASSINHTDHMLSPTLDLNELRYEALAIFAVFPPSSPDCSSIASDPFRVGFLIGLLFHPYPIEVRVNSASLLESIIAGTKLPELRSHMTNSGEIFAGVIGILTDFVTHPRALKVGVKTLFALCLNKHNRPRAVVAGAVHALIGILPELDKCDCERALATVELLCRVPQGCSAFGAHALTVPLLVKTILKVSKRATEYAVGALLSLCSTSEKLQSDAVNAGVLTQLLLVVQSGCTPRAKRKAQLLLKLLRDSWPEDSNGNSDEFNYSDIVPF